MKGSRPGLLLLERNTPQITNEGIDCRGHFMGFGGDPFLHSMLTTGASRCERESLPSLSVNREELLLEYVHVGGGEVMPD